MKAILSFAKANACVVAIATCLIPGLDLPLHGQNFIPNPGFETQSGCPSSVAMLPNATGWYNPTSHAGSADYVHTCGGAGWTGVPSNAFGNQNAHTGSGYVGFALYYDAYPGFREYICCQLTSALTSGQAYSFSYYTTLADNMTWASDDVQIFLSSTLPSWPAGNWNPMTTYTPQASHPNGVFISDKTNWTQYTYTFTATAGMQYLTLGNFKTDAATSIISGGAGSITAAYIFVDDLVLQPDVVLNADIAGLEANPVGGDVQVRWQTTREEGTARFELERSLDDMVTWERIATQQAGGTTDNIREYGHLDITAIGGVANHYRIRVVDLDGEAHYSNAVSATPALNRDRLLSIAPNPAPVGASIRCGFVSASSQDARIVLHDAQGRAVRDISLECQPGYNPFEVSTSDLAPGQYILRFQAGSIVETQRVTLL